MASRERALYAMLVCLAAALGCGGARPLAPLPDARDFDPGERALVDETYRFRLAAPGDDWRLLEGAEATTVSPNARALAMQSRRRITAVVLVERSDDLSLEDMAKLHAAMLELPPDKREVKRTQHQGREALVLAGVRTVDGQSLDVRSLILQHQQHSYGLRVMAPRQGSSPGIIDRVFDEVVRRFSLLSGAVRRPSAGIATHPDGRGPGWRVRGGIFESATSALRVTPPIGWRLVVGTELARINPDAEVGLQLSDPPVFLTVVAERVRKADLAPLREHVRAHVRPVRGGERHSVRWAGKPLTLIQAHAEGMPQSVTALFGMRFQRNRHYQFVLGHTTRDGTSHVQTALDALAFLEPAAEQALAHELSAGPDPQALLVGEHALWGGRFVDFARGITWVKPDAEWAAHIGSAAQAAEGATLVFEHGRHGLFGYLVPFDEVALDARGLLRGTLGELVSEGRAQQTPIHSLQLDADSSAACELEVPVDGLSFRFAMASVVSGDRGALLAVSGFPENMRSAEADVQAALRGLALPREPLPKQTIADGTFTSFRYGFKLTPPAGHTWSGPSRHEHDSIEFLTWSSADQMIALHVSSRRGLAERGRQLMRFSMERQLQAFGDVEGAAPEVTSRALSGRPGHRMSLDRKGMRVDVFATTRGDQMYLLTVVQRAESRSAARAEATAAGFALLD